MSLFDHIFSYFAVFRSISQYFAEFRFVSFRFVDYNKPLFYHIFHISQYFAVFRRISFRFISFRFVSSIIISPEELKRKLELKSENTEILNLNTFGSERYIKKSSDRVKVNIVVQDGVVTISALTSPAVCSPLNTRVDASHYPHLNGLALADSVDVSNKRIDILIGADHYYDIVIGEVIKGSAGLVAISSKRGWLLSGPVSFSNDRAFKVCSSNNVIKSNLVLDVIPSREEIVDESREIVESLDRFWKHESMGIANDEQPRKCALIEIMFKENQRYEVCLPWKDNIDNELETNYDLSKMRLLSLYNKLKADPKLL